MGSTDASKRFDLNHYTNPKNGAIYTREVRPSKDTITQSYLLKVTEKKNRTTKVSVLCAFNRQLPEGGAPGWTPPSQPTPNPPVGSPEYVAFQIQVTSNTYSRLRVGARFNPNLSFSYKTLD